MCRKLLIHFHNIFHYFQNRPSFKIPYLIMLSRIEKLALLYYNWSMSPFLIDLSRISKRDIFTSELQINAVYRIVDLCARVLVNAHRIGRDFDWIAFSTWVKLLKSGNSICASIDLCKRFEPFWPPLFCKGNYVWFYFCNEYYLNSDLLLKYL